MKKAVKSAIILSVVLFVSIAAVTLVEARNKKSVSSDEKGMVSVVEDFFEQESKRIVKTKKDNQMKATKIFENFLSKEIRNNRLLLSKPL